MTPQDEQRLSLLIHDFVAGCKFERPFHLVCIDARGSCSVTRYSHSGIERICAGPSKSNRFKMISPLVLTCISMDGVGRSATITVERARVTMQ